MNLDKPGLLDLESPATSQSPLEQLLAGRVPARSTARPQHPGPVLGKIVAVTEMPLVDFPCNPRPKPLPARHICTLTPADVGREAVLMFENNDYLRPIILGVLQPSGSSESHAEPVHVTLDGEQVSLSAKNEIVLRCGKASITLTRAGKVLIRGAYLLSRSSGVNRIKGGSVQIN